ncbi:hypothetical protein F66182_1930 [Fusarium sp. NRRL 66182]|nr:hypothetical protein F66182_1930 [Fusarium sp. NRRL 66182]
MASFSYQPIPRRAEADADAVFTQDLPPLTSSGKSLVVASCVMICLTTLWTIMRITAHTIRKTQYQIEDYLYFIGQANQATNQALYYGLMVSFILAVVVGGAGNNIGQLNPGHIGRYSRLALATQVLYAACLGFIKLAIIFMIRRIFRPVGGWFPIATMTALAICICWSLYTVLIAFFICLPVESAWGAAVPERCGDSTAAYAAVAILDIASECIIVVLPMKLVYDLQMSRAHKIALTGVFGAGVITIIFSCVRLYYVYHIDFVNITKSFAEASLSSVLQSGIAVMVASSPMLRPLFDRTARLCGLSLHSSPKSTNRNTDGTQRQTHSSGTNRLGVGGSQARAAGFKQMSESEEHLAWEMRTMGGQVQAASHVSRVSEHSDDLLVGVEMEEMRDQADVVTQEGYGPRKRVAPIVPLLILFFLVNLSMSLYQLPSNQLIERRLCLDYYRHVDPSKMQPDGSLDEQLCKIRDINKDLGQIQGAMETLWVAGDFIMTIPLSFLAEKWGRRSILGLNLLSRSFMLLWAVAVGRFDNLFPTRAIIAGPGLSVMGGDCVFNSITYAFVSNLTDDHVQRAIYFGYMNSVSYAVALLGPALAASTLTVSLWLPFGLGVVLLLLALPAMHMLPSQPRVNSERHGHDEELRQALTSSPLLKAQDDQKSLFRSVLSFMLTSLASSDTKLLIQYISGRYRWTFASAGYLLSGKAVVNFTLLAVVIPRLLRSGRQPEERAALRAVDRSNIRRAIMCLVASVIGALGIAVASKIWMLVPSMLVYALGSALPIFTLSLLKSPALSPRQAEDTPDSLDLESHVFSIVMLVKTAGSLIGAPLMAGLWVRGIDIGGAAFGMPFFASSACYGVAIWVIREIKVDAVCQVPKRWLDPDVQHLLSLVTGADGYIPAV